MKDLKTALETLADGFGGEIFLPGDSGFDEARAVWNAMIDRRPAVIARCRNQNDVIATVRLAGTRNLPIAVRGGGHNVAGHAVCDEGVMIDLSLMRGVDVDAACRVAVAEGGALWRDVDAADNLSAEGSDKYVADAMTENLIATLGQVPELFVIARNSAFTYKGKAVDVRQVSRELGVRYVLEGSVQQSGDNIRVTAQLIDATTGEHLWAERYDRPLDDLFALQDEIAFKILVSLQGKLTEGGDAALRSSSTDNVQAYLRYQEALNAFFKRTKDALIESRRLADEALKLDPRFATPRQLKAWTHIIDVLHGYSESPGASLAAAEAEIDQIGTFEDESVSTIVEGESSWVHAYVALLRGQYDTALEHGRKMLELIPNHADMLASYGHILLVMGQSQEAIHTLRRAMRLSPQYESWQARALSEALTLSGDHDSAVAAGEDAIYRAESDFNRARGHMMIAIAYADAGMVDLARDQMDRTLELAPDLTIERARPFYQLYRNESDAERFLDALRAAGLPE